MAVRNCYTMKFKPCRAHQTWPIYHTGIQFIEFPPSAMKEPKNLNIAYMSSFRLVSYTETELYETDSVAFSTSIYKVAPLLTKWSFYSQSSAAS